MYTRTIEDGGTDVTFDETLSFNLDCQPTDLVHIKAKHDSKFVDTTIGECRQQHEQQKQQQLEREQEQSSSRGRRGWPSRARTHGQSSHAHTHIVSSLSVHVCSHVRLPFSIHFSSNSGVFTMTIGNFIQRQGRLLKIQLVDEETMLPTGSE